MTVMGKIRKKPTIILCECRHPQELHTVLTAHTEKSNAFVPEGQGMCTATYCTCPQFQERKEPCAP